MDVRVKPFRSRWAGQLYLGPYVDWHDIDQVDIGLNLGPLILGLRFLWGNRIIDPYEVDRAARWDIGTSLQNDFGRWRYSRAGVKLKKGTIVEPSLAAKVLAEGQFPAEPALGELIYGDVRPVLDADKVSQSALGWPEVDVPERYYFWLHEVPPGATFQKEATP